MSDFTSSLDNEGKYVTWYYDEYNNLCILDKKKNKTFRLVPNTSSMGFFLEVYMGGGLEARRSVSTDDLEELMERNQEVAA